MIRYAQHPQLAQATQIIVACNSYNPSRDKALTTQDDTQTEDQRAARIAHLVLEAALKEVARLASDLDRVSKAITRANQFLEKFDEILNPEVDSSVFDTGRFTSFISWWRDRAPEITEEVAARLAWCGAIDYLRSTGLMVIIEMSDSQGPIVVRVEK